MLGEGDKYSFYFDSRCFFVLGVFFDLASAFLFLALFILESQGGVGEVSEQ